MIPIICSVPLFNVFADVLTAVGWSNKGKAILKVWEAKIIVSEFWGKIDAEDLPRKKMSLGQHPALSVWAGLTKRSKPGVEQTAQNAGTHLWTTLLGSGLQWFPSAMPENTSKPFLKDDDPEPQITLLVFFNMQYIEFNEKKNRYA